MALSEERIRRVEELALQIPGQEEYPPVLEAVIDTINARLHYLNTHDTYLPEQQREVNSLEEELEIAQAKLRVVLEGLGILDNKEEDCKDGTDLNEI